MPEMTDEQRVVVAIVVAVAIALIVLAIVAANRGKMRRRGQSAAMPPPPRSQTVEIARIREEISQTAGGGFCTALLVLHQLGTLVFFTNAKGAIQEAVVATLWVGGNVLWGLGVAIGRRRTYIVTRETTPIEPG